MEGSSAGYLLMVRKILRICMWCGLSVCAVGGRATVGGGGRCAEAMFGGGGGTGETRPIKQARRVSSRAITARGNLIR